MFVHVFPDRFYFAKESYSDEDKRALLELNKKYKFSALNPPANTLLFLNKIRGSLFGKRARVVEVVADGRVIALLFIRRAQRGCCSSALR